LEVELPPHAGSFAYRINLGGSIALEVRSGFLSAELADLLALLARTPRSSPHPGAL
jgi:hypothetical protein